MKNLTQAGLTAKAIRAELKKAFPSIKFSVTSENYSMGDAVRISYTNGVPTKDVEAITNKYQYGDFDSMTDMYKYTNNRTDIPQVKYVQVSRGLEPDTYEDIKLDIATKYGIEDINNENEWYEKTGEESYIKVHRESLVLYLI